MAAAPPTAVIKMRCTRVSQYDQGGQNMKEAQFVSTDREGKPLNPPEQLAYANFTGSFISPFADGIVHDALVDLSMVASAEASPSAETQDSTKSKPTEVQPQ